MDFGERVADVQPELRGTPVGHRREVGPILDVRDLQRLQSPFAGQRLPQVGFAGLPSGLVRAQDETGRAPRHSGSRNGALRQARVAETRERGAVGTGQFHAGPGVRDINARQSAHDAPTRRDLECVREFVWFLPGGHSRHWDRRARLGVPGRRAVSVAEAPENGNQRGQVCGETLSRRGQSVVHGRARAGFGA